MSSTTFFALLLIAGALAQNQYGNPNQNGQNGQSNYNPNQNQYGNPNNQYGAGTPMPNNQYGNQNGNQYGTPMPNNQYNNGNQYGGATPMPNNQYNNGNQYGGANPNSQYGNQNGFTPNPNNQYGVTPNSNNQYNNNQYGGTPMPNNGYSNQYNGGGCTLGGKMVDIVFIIDETANVLTAAWEVQLVANLTMGMQLGQQGIQVGLITITQQPNVIFNLNTYTNNQALYNAIVAQMPTQDLSNVSPNLASAMNLALQQEFTSSAGMRPTNVAPNAIVIVSDGRDNSNVAAAYQQTQQTQTNVFGIYSGNQNNQQAIQQLNAATGGKVLIASQYPTFDQLRMTACQYMSQSENGGNNGNNGNMQQQPYYGGQGMNNNMNNNYGG
jgi:hypothetical protein